MNLLRSESFKLRSVRTTWAMVGIGLSARAFAGLYVGLVPLETLVRSRKSRPGQGC